MQSLRSGLTAKEAAALEYADAFARLFGERYPHRRPLYLAPANEAGVRKLVRRSRAAPRPRLRRAGGAQCVVRAGSPALHACACMHASAGHPSRRPAQGTGSASSSAPSEVPWGPLQGHSEDVGLVASERHTPLVHEGRARRCAARCGRRAWRTRSCAATRASPASWRSSWRSRRWRTRCSRPATWRPLPRCSRGRRATILPCPAVPYAPGAVASLAWSLRGSCRRCIRAMGPVDKPAWSCSAQWHIRPGRGAGHAAFGRWQAILSRLNPAPSALSGTAESHLTPAVTLAAPVLGHACALLRPDALSPRAARRRN